jgi:hypothetical protein
LLRLIKACGSGHTGGDLSCLDIINVLYNRILRVSPESFRSPDRDYYIQSKGHCAEALFVVLAERGFFPETFGSRAVVEVEDLQGLMRYVCRQGFEHHAAISDLRQCREKLVIGAPILFRGGKRPFEK